MKRLAVFFSGNGSNLQALIDAIQERKMNAEIVVSVSNRKAAYGLKRSEQANIPTLYFPLKPYRDMRLSREVYDRDLAKQVSFYEPDLIILAGWMHILGAPFLEQYRDKVINLHPALPGQFAGTQAIKRAYKAFRRGEIDHTGVMVHWVVPEIDAGPVIVSRPVSIFEQDSERKLEERVHNVEHELLVEAVNRLAG